MFEKVDLSQIIDEMCNYAKCEATRNLIYKVDFYCSLQEVHSAYSKLNEMNDILSISQKKKLNLSEKK